MYPHIYHMYVNVAYVALPVCYIIYVTMMVSDTNFLPGILSVSDS